MMFVYQPIFSTLQLKKYIYKCIVYGFNWKSKGVFISILSSLNTAFFQSIKLLEYKMRIKFHNL